MSEVAWIQDVIYLLPLVGLIWKAAQQSSEVKQLRKDMDANTKKFCEEHKELEQAVQHNKIVVDDVMKSVAEKLTSIQVSIARIETALDMSTDKKND